MHSLLDDDTVTDKLAQSISLLRNKAEQGFVRFPVFVFGGDDYLHQVLAIQNTLLVVSDTLTVSHPLPWRSVSQWLGKDVGSIALDIRNGLDVDRLCSIAGCVTGGELVYLLCGERDTGAESPFMQRLYRFSEHPCAAVLCQHDGLKLPAVDVQSVPKNAAGQTDDQLEAIAALHHVLRGHRRRPALLVADRGRGKSTAMGIAAAQMATGLGKHIIVTSPSFKNVQTLFSHAKSHGDMLSKGKFELIAESGGRIEFVAPDALLMDLPDCDMLMVDEAAAIPLPMLASMLRHYSRAAFSSTEHGYEGTGRAFSLRFRKLLDEEAKGWKACRLASPIRWANNDPLEAWLFAVFLFDAEPDVPQNPTGSVVIKALTVEALMTDEALLRQLFGLLVSAHYQTSPNDLVQLLDGEAQTLMAAYQDHLLVGAALVFHEGGFDAALSRAVIEGKRRIRGHLLAQSLAVHVGLSEVLEAHIARVSRIAVLPACRQQGIGKSLLAHTEQLIQSKGFGHIGTSFGLTQELLTFWLACQYQPARLGVNRDAASGTYSIQLIKALGQEEDWQRSARMLFSHNLNHQLCEQFSMMSPRLVSMLVALGNTIRLCPLAENQTRLFANNQLGYDLCTGSLWNWFVHWLGNHGHQASNDEMCSLVVMRLLQRRSWSDTAKRFGLAGRKDVEHAMKKWFAANI